MGLARVGVAMSAAVLLAAAIAQSPGVTPLPDMVGDQRFGNWGDCNLDREIIQVRHGAAEGRLHQGHRQGSGDGQLAVSDAAPI